MDNLKIGILYLALHNQLCKKYGVNSILTRKEFYIKVSKHGQVPMPLRHLVLKEMEKKRLIKRINRDKIQVLSLDINLESEKDCKKIFNLAGLY